MSCQDSSAQPRSAGPARRPALRRELRFSQTASVSVGVMAPTLAMSVTGVAAAGELGRAAPLAFAVAALGVGLVAYGFVRLAGEFSHAGSVYAFVGNTLGPRPGFLAGWALLGTYLVFPPVSIMGVAIVGRAFLDATGLSRAAAQSLGFGTGAAGVSAFRHSQAPLGELAQRYVGGTLASLLDLGAVLSALGAGLGGVTVAARMLFAFGRD